MANQFGIILVNTGIDSFRKQFMRERYNFPPYGLLSIASVLISHGYKVYIIDLLTEAFTIDEFRKKLHDTNEEIIAVGITTYTESFHLSIEVARIVKEEIQKAKIIYGGVHASFEWEEALHEETIDYVVRGEGESTIVELLEHIKYPKSLPIERIAGLSFRDKKGISCSSAQRSLITNVDTLPLPQYKLISNNESYSHIVSVISSRGCPGLCIFCSSKAYSGSKYRMHSAYWLFSLLYYYYNRIEQFNIINFMDDTFTASRKRLLLFFKCMDQVGWDIAWACKSRVDALDEEIIKSLAAYGCKSVHLGIESGDQTVLDKISKGIKLEKCFNVIELLFKNSINSECSFMIGLPCDTLETIDKTLFLADLINRSKIGIAVVGIATPYPGTKMSQFADKLGMTIVDKKWNNYTTLKPTFYTNNFTIDDIRKAMYLFKQDKTAIEKNSIISNMDLSQFKDQIQTWIEKVKENQCIDKN